MTDLPQHGKEIETNKPVKNGVQRTGTKKRDELMIIYAEDLSPTKLTAGDLAPGGKAADQWEGMARELMERTLKGISLVKD